jgi:Secretion system C-terminal sorting domain
MRKKLLSEICQISFCICVLMGISNMSFAQGQFGIYQFTGTSSGNGQFNSVTAQPSFGTFSTFTRTGCTWLTGYANAWASETWPTTLNTGFYHQFTFTPNAGTSISITSITFTGWRNGTSGGFTLRSSQDGYTANISGPLTMTTTANTPYTFTIAGLCNITSAITFRIYGTGNASTTDVIIDEVALNGVMTPVASAGSSQSICSGSVTLAANAISLANSFPNPGGLGTWSVTSGPNTSSAQFGNVNTNNTTFTPAGGSGTYSLRWTATHSGAACHTSISNVSITVIPTSAPPALNIYALDYLGNTVADASSPNATICEQQSLDFYVSTPFVNVLPNTFTWKKNGTPVLVQTNVANYVSAHWQSSTFATGDVVTLDVTWPTPTTSPVLCYSPSTRVSQSLNFTVTPNQPPLVVISHNFPTDTICRGNQVTFTATVFNAGSPTYQWFLDGNPVGIASTYTTLATLAAGNHNIWCEIVSSEPCDLMDPIYTQWTSSAPISLVVNNCYYYVPASGTLGPYFSCGSPFYDSALDLAVNYANNENGLTKFCPAVATQYVTISFTSVTLNDAGDRLRIFSGTPSSTFTADTTGIPLLNLAGPTSSAGCGSTITSNVSGGCLTAHFKSDGAGNAAGWVSNLTCSPTPSPGPLPGSTCANAIVISALPYSVTNHTTQCYGADYTSQTGICNTSYTGEDRVYQYTATGPECTSMTLSATTGTPTLSVYSGCPGSVGTICLTPIPQSGNSTAQITFPSAGTYYIIVDEAGGATAYSSYNLNIQSFGLAPANDLPCNVQYIDLLVSVNGNTSCTGSASEPASVPACWTTGTINATWHSFLAPASGSVRIRTSSGTIGSTQIALYSLTGSCSNPANFTLLSCNRIGPTCNAPNPLITSSEIAYSGLTPNTLYYVRVDGVNNNTGNYSIIVVDQSTPSSQQPYVAGQDCVVPLPICSPQFEIPSPGFYGTGWVCDFTTSNNSCLTSGELNSLWLVFSTSGSGTVSWKLKPYGTTYPPTDYDWVLMDITSFGTDQASRVAGACPQINANNLPFVRCNLTFNALNFPTCNGTVTYSTGMCPAAPSNTSPPSGAEFNTSINVTANQTYLLFLMNHWQNNIGFSIDFNAFGTSPIIYQSPPQVVFWTGTVSTDWFDAANWGNCGPPNCSTSAILYSGALNYPVIPAGPTATCKNLDIKAGATITLTGTAQMDICGNFVNNGNVVAATTTTVRVMGTGAQYFDGSMIGSNAFGNLWMNKTSNHMTILDNSNVAGNLMLGTVTGGKIITGSKQLYVTNSAPGAISSFGAGSYVEGNLRRNLNGTAGTYYYPVGTSAKGFNLAQIDFTGTHSIPSLLGYFNDTAVPIQPGPLGPECPTNDFATLAPFNNGYWTLTASANASSATYNMLLFSNLTAVTNNSGNAWTILKNPGTGWTLNGSCNGTSTASITKRDAMTGFSDFTVGQSGAPLPVELLSFDAVIEGSTVLTSWVTATEVNNDYFVVERSADGTNFEQVGRRNGAGNSSVTLYYSMVDNAPLPGISYYRLRQVDFDGKQNYSQMVAVNFTGNNVLTVFPNPAQTQVQFSFNSEVSGKANFELLDAVGKTVLSQEINVKKGLNVADPIDIRHIPNGVYFIRVNGDMVAPMQKLFVKRTMQE